MEQIARTPKQLGAALRRKRKHLGLSQAELGQGINLRQATVSALEGGEVDTKLTTLLDALAALNLERVVRPRSTGSSADIEALEAAVPSALETVEAGLPADYPVQLAAAIFRGVRARLQIVRQR